LVHQTEVGVSEYLSSPSVFPLLSADNYRLEQWPDGLRISSSGLIVVGVKDAADVVDPRTGALLGKFNCPDDIIYNVERIAGTGTWFLIGGKHIYRVEIAETSPSLAGS
jgi:hypothetical protein